MKFNTVIVRFGGEIGIKGAWTRKTYEKLLLGNVKNTLKHHNVPYENIIYKRGRIYVKTMEASKAASTLTKVFGVSSTSPAVETISAMESIINKSLELADETLTNGSSFAVRCRRTGKHPYSSMDVCRIVGKQILTKFKNRNIKVNLKNPDVTVNIEVRDEKAYVFKETFEGVDGFPLGSQPKIVALLSGGMDSAVACWLVMKRGCPVIPLHFDITPFTDKRIIQKAQDVTRALFEWAVGFPRKLYIVPHGENLRIFQEEAPKKFTCILCKRLMYRIAERIAEKERAEGIVTGESIGEQASQTLQNLKVLNEAIVNYPVHRPILGFNKTETEEIAKKIGVLEIATRKSMGCKAAPKKPATKAKLEVVKEVERKLPIERMVEESFRAARIVEI
ncbi:tRNA 4-thiouridine(8) synthase ThiI [Candidatus Bathyarchaeota archaeon]|nr:tRNA 4-thiouridine(8) synthase ThiI [Candidatus Bathyarchaeota archaeon]